MIKSVQKVLILILFIALIVCIKDIDKEICNFTLEKNPKQEENIVEPLSNAEEVNQEEEISLVTDSVASTVAISETTVIYKDECDFLNNAPMDSLLDIKYIGKVTANKIIEYRENKEFESTEELMNLKGIGSKKYKVIREGINDSIIPSDK